MLLHGSEKREHLEKAGSSRNDGFDFGDGPASVPLCLERAPGTSASVEPLELAGPAAGLGAAANGKRKLGTSEMDGQEFTRKPQIEIRR